MTKRSDANPQPAKARWGNRFGVKHGGSYSDEYRCWKAMRFRCNPKRTESFPDYAGRGIRVCDRWQDFNFFLEDLGPRPSREYSLDRIDVNGHYEPGNVRWATSSTQSRNRRTTRLITWKGESLCIDDWALRLGVKRSALWRRFEKGLSPDDILGKPIASRSPRHSSSK